MHTVCLTQARLDQYSETGKKVALQLKTCKVYDEAVHDYVQKVQGDVDRAETIR